MSALRGLGGNMVRWTYEDDRDDPASLSHWRRGVNESCEKAVECMTCLRL